MHVENLEGEWGAFNEIIKRKDSSIQTQVASLQQKIVLEDKAVETRTNDFLVDWERSKPVEGHLRPDEALSQLQFFESKFARLKEERDNVAKAKEALELQEPGNNQSCFYNRRSVTSNSCFCCFKFNYRQTLTFSFN